MQVYRLFWVIDMTKEQKLQCPRCHHHNNKFYVNVDKGVFHCYHCDFSGKLDYLRSAYPSLYSNLEDVESIAVFDRLKNRLPKLDTSGLLHQLKPFREIEPSDEEYSYLLQRGWDDNIISCYTILVSENPFYANRVYITIQNDNDEVIFYAGRSIKDQNIPKYLNSNVQKDFIFKSITPIDHFYNESAYICEGIFDAFKLPGGIALLGKTLVKTQQEALFSFLREKKSIYICLDPKTEKESTQLAKELDSWFPNKKIFILSWGNEQTTDLGDLSKSLSHLELTNFIKSNSSEFSSFLHSRLKL